MSEIKPGYRVIETAQTCQQGDEGTVYRSEDEKSAGFGLLIVRWDNGLHTSLTHGSRNVYDLPKDELARLREISANRPPAIN